jgi:hypothetical protein
MKEETMELKHYAIVAASALAFAGGVQAQTSDVQPETDRQGDTIIIVTPPDAATNTPGSSAVFTPMDDANRTLTRDEIKSETRSAVRQGQIPRGELGQADETQHTQPADTYNLSNPNRP